MAQILQCPLEEVLTAILASSLPDVEDMPREIQTELLQMTWLDDRALLDITQSCLSEAEQAQLMALRDSADKGFASLEEQQDLQALREYYGQMTLRKACAYALLSQRSSKLLLGELGTIRLSEVDFASIMKLLEDPPEPATALLKAAESKYDQ